MRVRCSVTWLHTSTRAREWSYFDDYWRYGVHLGTTDSERSYNESEFVSMEISVYRSKPQEGNWRHPRIPSDSPVTLHIGDESVPAAKVTLEQMKLWGTERIESSEGLDIYRMEGFGGFRFRNGRLTSAWLSRGGKVSVAEGTAFSLPINVDQLHVLLGKPEHHYRNFSPMEIDPDPDVEVDPGMGAAGGAMPKIGVGLGDPDKGGWTGQSTLFANWAALEEYDPRTFVFINALAGEATNDDLAFIETAVNLEGLTLVATQITDALLKRLKM
jgi:hypothetical protein